MSNEVSLPLIPAKAVEKAFPLGIAMETQRKVFAAFDRGDAVMGTRGVIPNGNDASFAYVARASINGPTIVKFGSVTNSNATRGLPVVQAYICILDPETGALTSFIDGESVTRIRTTAASMVAAQTLASKTANIAVIGAGLQGIAHARAAIELFSPESLTLVVRSITPDAKSLENEFSQIRISTEIDVAIDAADLVFVCTNTIQPIVTKPLKKGTTVISIGSFSPNREEISGEVVSNSDLIFGDDSQTIQTQSGSVIAAINLKPEIANGITSIGALLNNPSLGRTSPDQIILYFSVGLGIQDAAIVEKYLELDNK
jgi:ornithine cyclodeaminase